MLDAVVIGAGPAGLSAAINLRQRGKSVRVYYTGEGRLSYAERVDNFLGLPASDGAQITRSFREHAESLGVEMVKTKVLNVVPMGDHFMLSAGQDIVEARKVILTVGTQQSRTLPGEEALLGHGVSYCATCDGMLYRDKRAVVVGLSEEAAEEANFLHRIGVHVLYLSREEPPETLNPAMERRIVHEVAVLGEDKVRAVSADGEELLADGVFILRESIAPAAMVTGLELNGNFIRVNEKMETNLPGLYAAGDCVGPPFQAMKAAGEGQLAGLEASK